MKQVVDALIKKSFLFKSLEPLDPKELGTRKRLKIFHGIDEQDRYVCVFVLSQSSRILSKDVIVYDEIAQKLQTYLGHRIKQRFMFFVAPLCSKARANLEKNWRLFYDSL